MNKTFVITIDLKNPYLVTMHDVIGLEDFLRIFSTKTLLDFVGEAIELHFNGNLDENTLSDACEEILIEFNESQNIFNSFIGYMPYTRLRVVDKNNPMNYLLEFNFSNLITTLYWQVKLILSDYLALPTLGTAPNTVHVVKTESFNNELRVTVSVIGNVEVNPFNACWDKMYHHAPLPLQPLNKIY